MFVKRKDFSMEDFADAARRLYEDADLLDKSNRIATASHLYGFVGECVLKALMCNLSPVAKIPKNMKGHLPTIWSVFKGHSAMSNFPQRVSACTPFEAGYGSWQVDQRYWARAGFTRHPKLTDEKASARGLMSVLDQVQKGLL
jgi:hypothetical protein